MVTILKTLYDHKKQEYKCLMSIEDINEMKYFVTFENQGIRMNGPIPKHIISIGLNVIKEMDLPPPANIRIIH